MALSVRPWMWLAWFFSSLAVFGVLEYVAATNDEPNDTLTRTITEHVPWVAALGFLIVAASAALWHWWKTYASNEPGRLDE